MSTSPHDGEAIEESITRPPRTTIEVQFDTFKAREEWRKHCKSLGMSFNGFARVAIEEKMNRDAKAGRFGS